MVLIHLLIYAVAFLFGRWLIRLYLKQSSSPLFRYTAFTFVGIGTGIVVPGILLAFTDFFSAVPISVPNFVIAHPRHELVHYAASTELPARQARMAAKALKPRSIPVSITEQTAA